MSALRLSDTNAEFAFDPSPSIELRALSFVPEHNEYGRNTTLERDGVRVHTVEHVLAQITGLGIDNLLVELDSNEPVEPSGGSCAAFVEHLRRAGIQRQRTPKRTFVVRRAQSFREGDVEIHALPYDGFRVSFTIHYDNPVIGTQYASFEITPRSSRARSPQRAPSRCCATCARCRLKASSVAARSKTPSWSTRTAS